MAEAPRLFLITPPILDAEGFVPLMEAALANGDVACVLIRAAGSDPRKAEAIVRKLIPGIQARGAAALVEGISLAKKADADGIHVDCDDIAFGTAFSALKPDRIVGAGGTDRRDAAMQAGEAGADYLMFGQFREKSDQAAHRVVCDMVDWWSHLFNVPCVGYAYRPDVAPDIAKAGAEFVGLCDGVWDRSEDVAAIIAAVHRSVSSISEAVQ